MLGSLITGQIMFFLGQSWNRDDMKLLRSYVRELTVEQNMPRLAKPSELPQERSSTTARKKVINQFYKMEDMPKGVPSLPKSNNINGGAK